jgi:hypothetical protein
MITLEIEQAERILLYLSLAKEHAYEREDIAQAGRIHSMVEKLLKKIEEQQNENKINRRPGESLEKN